jgi:Flp pilus assembly protein TadD
MNANFLTIVKRIVSEQGESILADPQRLKGWISDYAKDEPKAERLAFGRCIEYGAYSELKNAPTEDRPALKNRLAKKMHNEEGLDITLCTETLDILEMALFGDPVPQFSTTGDEWVTVAEKQAAGQVQTTAPLPGPVPPVQPSPMNIPSGSISPNSHVKRNVLIAAAVIVAAALGVWFVSPFGRMVRAKPHFEEGVKLFDQKNYDGAIASFTEAIRLYPEHALAYAYRGTSYDSKKDYDLAIADCNEALRIDPNCAIGYVYRGTAYAHKGDLDRDIADCTEALRIDPRFVLAYIRRGNAYFSKGDYDRAIADYTEAIRLNPQDAEAYSSRGVAYDEKQNHDQAIADCTEAIRLDPQDAETYLNRGYAYNSNHK